MQKITHCKLSLFSYILLLLALPSCSISSPESDLETVDFVDLNKYAGTWYEIARYENSFQKKCLATRATYNQQDDYVEVLNECRTTSGKLDQAYGRAFSADQNSNAKLKVSFVPFLKRFGLFTGDYWIIELDSNYQYAVIGHPERKYLWILSREKKMNNDIYKKLLSKLKEEHKYNIDKLKKTPSWEK